MTDTEISFRDMLSRHAPALTLGGIFFGYVAFVVVAMCFPPKLEGVYWAFVSGVLVFLPMILGVWTALASGSVLTRLPVVTGCLLFLCVIPGLDRARLSDLDRSGFTATIVIGFLLFVASLLLFLLIRRLTRWRITIAHQPTIDGKPRVRFSIKYLLALLTLYAVALGTLSQISFREAPPPSIFAPNFFLPILIRIAATFSAAALPTIAIPLFILSDHRSARFIQLAIVIWLIVTAQVIVFWLIVGDDPWTLMLKFVLMAQLGAAVVGVLSAFVLRLAGFRLLRLPQQSPSRASKRA